MKHFLFGIVFLLFISCKEKPVEFKLDDIIKTFEEANLSNDFDYITKENLKRHPTNKNLSVIKLFETYEVFTVEVIDSSCKKIKLFPHFNNSLLHSEWDEYWLIYNNNCKGICHEKVNGIDVLEENIKPIKDNWYYIKAKGKRYIGG